MYTWSREGPFGNPQPDGTVLASGNLAPPGFLEAVDSTQCVTESTDGMTVSSKTGCPGAGHRDWRLPTACELQTIVDCSHGAPCVAPILGPTQSHFSWSSWSYAYDPNFAWNVPFLSGYGYAIYETYFYNVRAVRGGF